MRALEIGGTYLHKGRVWVAIAHDKAISRASNGACFVYAAEDKIKRLRRPARGDLDLPSLAESWDWTGSLDELCDEISRRRDVTVCRADPCSGCRAMRKRESAGEVLYACDLA